MGKLALLIYASNREAYGEGLGVELRSTSRWMLGAEVESFSDKVAGDASVSPLRNMDG